MAGRLGVLLLAFGGADSIESVAPFVKNVLKGRPVTPELIKKTEERYALIGGKSPLLDITRAQAEAIEAILKKDGYDFFNIYIGMRYWHPFIKDAVSQMKADGVHKAFAIIMSPFTSLVATGGYEEDVKRASAELGGAPDVEYAERWHLHAPFVETVAENVKRKLALLNENDRPLVVFSNHSLPMNALEGDPYEVMINQAATEVMKKAGAADYRVAYQSKGAGPREWKGPSTEEVIEQAAKDGRKGVVVVPLGFAADHVETLYDIDIVFKGLAEKNGLKFERTESLNTSPRFIDLLASLVKKFGDRERVYL